MRVLRFLLRLLAIIVVFLLVLYGYFALTFKPRPLHAFHQGNTEPLLIAHRGGKGLRPENTLSAFALAQESGADLLELDVHLTADGQLVVIHDDTVDRTTDGSGSVRDMTLEQIRALDAGHRYETATAESDAGAYPFRGAGLRIPTFSEVLQEFPALQFLIEIKPNSSETASALCEILRENAATARAMVSSFYDEPLQFFRENCPEVATSATENEVLQFYLLNKLGLDRVARPVFDAFALPTRYDIAPIGEVTVITEGLLAGAALHEIPVYAWTINTEAEMRRLLELGVAGIITDYPGRFIAARDSTAVESGG